MTDVSTTCAEAQTINCHLTLKMASAQVAETEKPTTVVLRTPINQMIIFQSRRVTPGFEPFSYLKRIKIK